MTNVIVTARRGLRGEVKVPGDKSISHRAIILSSIAEGITGIHGIQSGEDVRRTAAAFQTMGVSITREGRNDLRVHGVGLKGLREPNEVLDLGNSGTSMRLLVGLLSGQRFFSVLTGDRYLCNRPMGRVSRPLRSMGATIMGREDGNLPPLAVRGGELHSISHRPEKASAQVKSCLLLAGLYAEGGVTIEEPVLTRDHTERMLGLFGLPLEISGTSIHLEGGLQLRGGEVWIPGDISGAAFVLAAALLVPDSEITVRDVGVNPTRTGFLDAMAAMGGRLKVDNLRERSGEPIADISAYCGPLKGIELRGSVIPGIIDELPILSVLASVAEGQTVIADAGELRVKETDRIRAMVEGLRKMGVDVEEKPDGLIIQGNPSINGARCSSYGDHRIAMSFIIAGLRARGETIVEDTDCVNTSFPGFMRLLESL